MLTCHHLNESHLNELKFAVLCNKGISLVFLHFCSSQSGYGCHGYSTSAWARPQ